MLTTQPRRASPPAAARRVRELEARRRDILAAARTVFARRGYSAATLDEIAARAAFAKGTLYNYFRSKEDLFRDVVVSIFDDLARIAQEAAAGGGASSDVFLRYATSAMDYYKEHQDFLRIAAREMTPITLRDKRRHMDQMLACAQRIGGTLASVLRQDVREGQTILGDPQDLAEVFVAIIHHRSIRYFFQDKLIHDRDTHDEAEFITHLFFRGAFVHAGA